MQRKVGLILLAMTAAFALYSCGTENIGQTNLPEKNASGFKLDVSEDSYLFGSSASGFAVDVKEIGEDVVVDINVENASRLTAVYFDLEYNAEQYRPMTALPTEAMGHRDDFLRLNYMKDRGTVHYGQVLMNPQLRSGFTGSGTVAQVYFLKEATPMVRTVSTPPASAQSQPDLEINGAGDTLTWSYFNQGDYNQDGRVTVQDLTPIGINFQDAADDGPDGPKAVVDGNNDGTISVQDLTPIGVNFGRRLDSYNIYASANVADYPASNTDPSTIAELDNVLLTEATDNATLGGRKQFMATVPVDNTMLYWVRAVDEAGVEGARSDLATNAVGILPSQDLDASTPAESGAGTSGSPYVLLADATYRIVVTDPTDGDVSVNAATVFVSSEGTISVAKGATDATFDVPAAFNGTFNIATTYDGTPANTLFFSVGGPPPPGGLFIRPDETDPDWAGVPNFNDAGAGETSADAYVMHDSTFNTVLEGDNSTFTLDFQLEAASDDAFTEGLTESDLTWGVFPLGDGSPDFLVEWVNDPRDGLFKVNFLTNAEIVAQNDDMDESNHIFVFSQLDQ